MGTNGLNHETHEKKNQDHEWTRMGTNGREWIEPRMDTKYTKRTQNHEWTRMYTKRTQNHEWTRMYTNGLNHETHEIHEKKNQNHEWTRMGTNIIYSLYGFIGC